MPWWRSAVMLRHRIHQTPFRGAINQYAWPGNVQELINRIRQGVAMAEHPDLTPEDLGMSGAHRARDT